MKTRLLILVNLFLWSSVSWAERVPVQVFPTGQVAVNMEEDSSVSDGVDFQVQGNVSIDGLLKLPPLDNAPLTTEEGSIYLSSSGNLNVYLQGAWKAFASAQSVQEQASDDKKAFVFQVKTDNLGASEDHQFTIGLRSNHIYDFNIDWGDGIIERISTYDNLTHDYENPGVYSISIVENFIGGFPTVRLGDHDPEKVIALSNWGLNTWLELNYTFRNCKRMRITATDHATAMLDSVTSLSNTWFGCSGLTSFPLLDFSGVSSFGGTWLGCTGLTSFPLIDTSHAVSLSSAWHSCIGLVNFPQLDTSSVEDFTSAWKYCRSLTTFPTIDTAKGKFFNETWDGCFGISPFPNLDFSLGQNFARCWRTCIGLDGFDFPGQNFPNLRIGNEAFDYVMLSTNSYSNLLISLLNNNTNTGVVFNGGFSQLNADGLVAKQSLIEQRGWVITDGGAEH